PLPRSHLVIQISSRWHQGEVTTDDALFTAPSLFTPLTSTDYRSGVDPALNAILDSAHAPSLAQALAEPLRAADSAGLAQRFADFRTATIHRYANIEREMNSIGYQELGAGHQAAALLVFGLNAQTFPRSPNVYDSFGEALVKAGRSNEAIA